MNSLSVLDDARTLALFSNLTEKDAEYFQQNYPKFVPDRWWGAVYFVRGGFCGDYEIVNSPPAAGNENVLWRLWQKLLQESWTMLTSDRTIALLTMWSSTDESHRSVGSEVLGVRVPTAYPYQRAVMFLAMEPWRASFCENCGKRFVKDIPARRFCSDACSHESRKGVQTQVVGRARFRMAEKSQRTRQVTQKNTETIKFTSKKEFARLPVFREKREGIGLENRRARKSPAGSNPARSASFWIRPELRDLRTRPQWH